MQQTFVADLDEQGFILWEQLKFVTPSAWSIHVKRLANPSKKADDGWKSIKYTPTGETLEVFKDRLSLMQVCSFYTYCEPLPQTQPRKQD